MELCALCGYWSVLFSASQCKDTRGYPNLFRTFPAWLIPALCSAQLFPPVSHPLSLPCGNSCPTHSIAALRTRSWRSWCPRSLWPPCSRKVWEGRTRSLVQGSNLVTQLGQRKFSSHLGTQEEHSLPATLASLSWGNFEVLFPCLWKLSIQDTHSGVPMKNFQSTLKKRVHTHTHMKFKVSRLKSCQTQLWMFS